jgi:hypothetical protein
MSDRSLFITVLCLIALLTSGCSRSYRILPGYDIKNLQGKSFAIIILQSDLINRGVGSIGMAPIGSQESFRRSVLLGVKKSMSMLGIEGVDVNDSQISIADEAKRLLILEMQLERRKILAEMELQGSFTRYARYISSPPLKSYASQVLQEDAVRLNVSGFLLVNLKATKLTRVEYVRELIRGALITVFTLFSNVTIAHRAYMSGDVMLVDGKSGKVLFFNSVTDLPGSPGSPEDSFELFQELLDPLT